MTLVAEGQDARRVYIAVRAWLPSACQGQAATDRGVMDGVE